MKLTKDKLRDEIIIRFKEREYLIVLAALKAATADDQRKGIDYWTFYNAEKGDIVRLHNKMDAAERRCN